MTDVKRHDARALDHKTLEEIRIRAVERVQAGESPEAVIQALGFTRSCIYPWLANAVILHCLIGDVLGSPTFKRRSNEDQGRLVRVGEPALLQQALFGQTVNRVLYCLTAGRKSSTTGDPELAQREGACGIGHVEWSLA